MRYGRINVALRMKDNSLDKSSGKKLWWRIDEKCFKNI